MDDGQDQRRTNEPLVAAPLLRELPPTATTAKLILMLFVNVLNGAVEQQPDWTSSVTMIRRLRGKRWVSLTQQEIADALGIRLHQVRRALGSLQQLRLVEVETIHGRNLYRILFSDFIDDPIWD